MSGPRISIEPLPEDQQLAIGAAQLGAAGEKIVDEAWRAAGIRELIAIPLYLSALLLGDSNGARPTTKEEVLRLFIQTHERAHDHAEVLFATLFNCHEPLLTALAAKLNSEDATTMTETEARRVIAREVEQLRAQGQITGLLEAECIAFVDRWHRPGIVDRAVRFMIITGKPDFERYVWPLAWNSDPQIRIATLRAASRFRPDRAPRRGVADVWSVRRS